MQGELAKLAQAVENEDPVLYIFKSEIAIEIDTEGGRKNLN